MASDLPRQVAAFRVDYRRDQVPLGYDGRLHLALTTLIGWSAFAICLWRLDAPSWLELLTVPIMYVVANLAEYMGHKNLMHSLVKPFDFLYQRHAAVHHRFFTIDAMPIQSHRDFMAVIFPVKVSLFYMVGLALPLGLAAGLVFGSNVGWLVGATAIAYYQAYEALHLMTHLPESSWLGRRWLVGAMRHHHAIHHDTRRMRQVNFNITVPLWDLILGTLDTKFER